MNVQPASFIVAFAISPSRRIGNYEISPAAVFTAGVAFTVFAATCTAPVLTAAFAVANLGLRHQPNDRINEYFKQDISGQLQMRWNRSWSSRFGAELRNKYFPNNEGSIYSSVMVEGGLRRQLSAIAHVSAGYLTA